MQFLRYKNARFAAIRFGHDNENDLHAIWHPLGSLPAGTGAAADCAPGTATSGCTLG